MANPNIYDEVAYVAIHDATTTTTYQFSCMTETWGLDYPDKDFEGINLVCGGRIKKHTPQGDGEFTLELYPTSAELSSTGIFQFMERQSSDDSSQPITLTNSHKNNEYDVVVLMTDAAVSDATAAVASGNAAMRHVIRNAELISAKPSFDDNVYKVSAKFKATAYNKSGTGNYETDSTDGTATLTAVSF